MENKHTAGKWKIVKDVIGNTFISDGKNNEICRLDDFQHFINNQGISDKEAEANAKLIAGSPLILDALIHAYSHMVIDTNYQGRNILETMQSAIKAATN